MEKNIVIRASILICCLVLFAGCSSSTMEIAEPAGEIQDNTLVADQLVISTEPAIAMTGETIVDDQQAKPETVQQDTGDKKQDVFGTELDSDFSYSKRRNFVSSLRVWRDREMQFSTNAELLEVSLEDRTIKLLKENGFAITVPIERLSEHDKNFLIHFVSSQSEVQDSDFPAESGLDQLRH